MAKLIVLGIVLFTALAPIPYATRSHPRRNLRTIQVLTVLAVFAWAVACRHYYPGYVFAE
ncbi:MAG: hypothetical protein ACRENE_08030 [Polyangiaceae bacterium]